MDIQTIITELESEWDLENGFLGGLRQGDFRFDRLERLVRILKSIELSSYASLDKRFVAITWYIPVFMIWQRERFIEMGKEVGELNLALNTIEELLEEILGTP